MRRGQPLVLFVFTVLVGLARVFSYAGTTIGQGLSFSLMIESVALHAAIFCLVAFLMTAFSRATVTRATQVALYAQALLFLAPFVDIGIGAPVGGYWTTYGGFFGGSAGSLLAGAALAAILGWGVWDASVGRSAARRTNAVIAALLGFVGASLVAIPAPELLLIAPIGWEGHIALAVYYGALGAALSAGALWFGNRGALRSLLREIRPVTGCGFALFAVAGVLSASRFADAPLSLEPITRLQFEGPYFLAAAVAAASLWVEWRLIRSTRLGPLRIDGAIVAKVVALAFALVLGVFPFVAVGLAGSLAWLGRDTRTSPLIGLVGTLAIVAGNVSVVAVDFVAISLGPAILFVPISPDSPPTVFGLAVAGAVGILLALETLRPTSRTSA
ncbi:MAG: hypothetical protein E6K18_06665 [Methanobacteriota archaeon]|nr:MAG: hypothetical protein E6K18_06665 [Euryarchaeota archaeon]